LVLVPVIYHIVESMKDKRAKKKLNRSDLPHAQVNEGFTS
jgi:hypothetical protein